MKIFKDRKYLNKLVDQYNNTYDLSVNRKPNDSALSIKIETDPKVPKFKVDDRVRITK